ncbi:MAG: ABC transporter permease [Bacteroidaceae bacterium]|nr:ABC transporter permease [Bacteroidaceae bacterium]
MSYELFIAKRIYADKAEDGSRFSRPAIRIAMLGVAIGLAVMIVSLAVVLGFKHEVSSKVIGFGSHIQVLSLTQNQDYEMLPVLTNDTLIRKVRKVQRVDHIQRFATKLGILKTEENFRGLTFKGVGEDYDLSFFRNSLVDGQMPKFSSQEATNEILLSQKVASDLGVKTGDKIFAYFMGEESMRARRFKVAGIFATNMNDYDKNYVITDIYTVRKLNGWDDEMSSGLEVTVKDFDKVDALTQQLQFIHQGTDRNGVTYGVFSIKDIAAHTFAWLAVLDMNVVMILVLMILVSVFTVVSGLLIIMLERINMIGTLKVLGATNVSVRRIFIHFSVMLVGKGLLWGNLVGLLLCFLQQQFHLISLDASVYYIDSVPIQFNWLFILALNLLTLLISTLVIWGSSHLISIGKPSETIRYE